MSIIETDSANPLCTAARACRHKDVNMVFTANHPMIRSFNTIHEQSAGKNVPAIMSTTRRESTIWIGKTCSGKKLVLRMFVQCSLCGDRLR